jgi:hypothetical protein
MKENFPMRHDLFNDIMENIDVDLVPLEFIILAKVIGLDGSERLVRGAELSTVIRGPNRNKIAGFNVILDVRKIRSAVDLAVNEIYDEVNRLCAIEQMELAARRAEEAARKNTDI